MISLRMIWTLLGFVFHDHKSKILISLCSTVRRHRRSLKWLGAQYTTLNEFLIHSMYVSLELRLLKLIRMLELLGVNPLPTGLAERVAFLRRAINSSCSGNNDKLTTSSSKE